MLAGRLGIVVGALLCTAGGPAWAQVITTIAGTDWSFPSTPRAALDSPLGDPRGVALDSSGNFYVSDFLNHRVMKVTPGGTLTVLAGNGIAGYSGDGGPATSAALYCPGGMAVDGAGNVFIADPCGEVIRQVSPAGIITTIAGNLSLTDSGDGGPATAAGLNAPQNIAADHAGNLYIATSGAVRKVTPTGTISTVLNDHDAGSFTPAFVVAVDSANNLYVAGGVASNIRKVTPGGAVSTVPTQQALPGISGIAIDGAGNLYLAASGAHTILKVGAGGAVSTVAGNGQQGFSGDGGPAVAATISSPDGIASDSSGNLYFSEEGSDRVRKVTASGTILTVAGNGQYGFAGDGGPALSAVLDYEAPIAIARDTSGNLFLADGARIRKIAPNGVITTVAGNGTPGFNGDGGPAISAQIAPSDVAVDAQGNLYIADNANNRIRKVTADGIIQTIAGNGTAFDSGGDGGPAIKAGIPNPQSVSVDGAGNLYVADLSNRVRKITPGGVITSVAGNGVQLLTNPPQGKVGDGGPATSASLGGVEGMAVDAAGNLYLADTFSNLIRKVDTKGIITTVAGMLSATGFGSFSGDGGAATSATLQEPRAVTLDASGNLFIADSGNQRIRKVDTAGVITTVAGNGNYAYSGDGGLAILAALNVPEGVAVDSAGNIYIADTFNSRVREVLAAPPTLMVSTAQLTFTGLAGGAPAPTQSFSVAASVAGVAFNSNVSPAAAGWLSVSTSFGNTPLLVDVVANPFSLAPGTYSGTIQVVAGYAKPFSITINVTFTVAAAANPVLSLDNNSLSFAFPRSGPAQSQHLTVSNAGSGTLNFTAAVATVPSGGTWLSVAPTSGQAVPATPAPLTVTANPTGLSAGTYTGAVFVTAGGSTTSVPVTMTISSFDQAIQLSQRGLTFTSVVSGGVVPAQTFSVLNIGTGSVNWTASTSTLPAGLGWLQVSPSAGTTVAGTPSGVTVTVDPSSLAAGSYYGLVRVDAAAAANSPQVLTVFLQVYPAGSDLSPVIQPGALQFTAKGGEAPGSQIIQVFNVTGSGRAFHASVSGGLLAGVLPTDGVLNPQQSTGIVVQPFTPNAPGVYDATLTLQFSDGRVIRVDIKAIVGAASSVSTAQGPARAVGGSCVPTKLLPAMVSLSDSFQVSAGWPVGLTVSVRDDCGNPLQSGAVTVGFSNGDPAIVMQPDQDGRWEATWPTRSASLGQITLKLHAEDPQAMITGDQQVPGALQSQQQPPAFDGSGVYSIFGGAPYTAVAPGGTISIYGDRLAESGLASSGFPLPTSLVDTQLLIAGLKMPLYYVSEGQVNAMVPFEVNTNTQHQILVQRGLTYSLPVFVNVAPAEPVILNGGPPQQGVVAYDYPASGGAPYLINSLAPAHVGDTVTFYCAGLGAVTPAVADGAAAGPSSSTGPVQLAIGGIAATVGFSGLSPGYAGLYQVNAVIPAGVPTGAAVPVTLTIAGQISPAVTITIQ